jgi:(1->4)-alpha-D-glucan 1-alpha-D-glucosylmutase
VVASFPVYRSYVGADGIDDPDKAVIGKATRWAYRRNPLLGKAVFDFVRDTVMLKDPPSAPASDEYRDMQRQFAGKFQQVTAPVSAKGVEDTAFYVYNRLMSLNEVGGEPGRFGWKPDVVHEFLAARAASPGGLSPLSTHDTKRGEDVRARINVLSEIPDEWATRVTRWAELNQPQKTDVDGLLAPDANEEYLLYQTLVGAWPEGGLTNEFRGRIRNYMRKALAEAKVHTSWINPDAEYDAAVSVFIDRLLDPTVSSEFLRDLGEFAGRVTFFGRINSLAQTVIRCTAPGVPDTYQGTEAWEFTLVDPDNRRPVDYRVRAEWLRDIDEGRVSGDELTRNLADPRAKLFVTALALRCRRDHPDVFARGGYTPLPASGERAAHLFAYLRTGEVAAVVVVPRLSVGPIPQDDAIPVGRVWGDTALSMPGEFAGRRWKNVFTGEIVDTPDDRLAAAAALGTFPVALLLLTA